MFWLQQRVAISRWVAGRPARSSGRVGSVAWNDSVIEGPDHTMLARRYVKNVGTGAIIALELPIIWLWPWFWYIIRVCKATNTSWLMVPWRTLDAANVTPREVIDQRQSRNLGRVTTLFRGKYRDSWGRQDRTSYYIAGWDDNERLSFYLCELPPDANPTNLDEAFEALKPPPVLQAEALGRRVKRQGDLFFVPMDKGFTPKESTDMFDFLHNTNHSASLVLRQDGATYARGIVRHDPSGRRRDHKNLALRKRWYLATRNTVPVVGR